MAAIVTPFTLANLLEILRGWRDDALNFCRHDAPKILLVLLLAFIAIRLLRAIVRRTASFQTNRLPGIRVQQIQTLAGVVTSVGVFLIAFVAFLMVLARLGLNLAPLLASAGIVGVALGFGAQTLVRDVINGFFILLENQYDVGDVVRIAGVRGAVEAMNLRSTVLRDDDGTVHTVPNGEIRVVSNTTRDWSQLALRVAVAYSESSDRIISLLKQVSEDLRSDPAFADDIVSDIQVPGIDRLGNGEAEYLVLVKTRPTKQYPVGRELRRRIREVFQQNKVQTAGPGRVYVMEPGAGGEGR